MVLYCDVSIQQKTEITVFFLPCSLTGCQIDLLNHKCDSFGISMKSCESIVRQKLIALLNSARGRMLCTRLVKGNVTATLIVLLPVVICCDLSILKY